MTTSSWRTWAVVVGQKTRTKATKNSRVVTSLETTVAQVVMTRLAHGEDRWSEPELRLVSTWSETNRDGSVPSSERWTQTGISWESLPEHTRAALLEASPEVAKWRAR